MSGFLGLEKFEAVIVAGVMMGIAVKKVLSAPGGGSGSVTSTSSSSIEKDSVSPSSSSTHEDKSHSPSREPFRQDPEETQGFLSSSRIASRSILALRARL